MRMQPQVVFGEWAEIWETTPEETRWIPKEHLLSDMHTTHTTKAFGARLSSPGYMDCTEWEIFDTAIDAWQHLAHTYPESFRWTWEPGHGYHMYLPTDKAASVIREVFQTIDGVLIEQDGEFLYTVSESTEPSDEIEWEEA